MQKNATIRIGFGTVLLISMTVACASGNPDSAAEETPTVEAGRSDASPSENGDADGEDISSPNGQPVEPLNLRLANSGDPASLSGASGAWFADELASRSGGNVTIEVFDLGSLLDATEILPGTVDGRTDLGMSYSVYHPEMLGALGVVAEPFVTTNAVASVAAIQHLYNEGGPIRKEFDQAGVKVLFFVPLSAGTFGTREPVQGLDDFAGLELRATGHTPKLLEAVGATGTFIPFSEVYQAVQRGAVDGWATTDFSTTVGSALYEVTPHYLAAGTGVFGIGFVAIGTSAWNELTAAQQNLIDDVSSEYIEFVDKELADMESAGCDEVTDNGGDIRALSDEDVDEWERLVGDSVLEDLQAIARDTGLTLETFNDLRNDYRALVEKYEDELDYRYQVKLCAEE